MNVGLLIVLFFASVPFLFEFETLGSDPRGTLSLSAVLRLRHFRSQRWAWGFAILFTVLVFLAAAPTASGKSYTAGNRVLFVVALSQIGLWVFAYIRVRRARTALKAREQDAA